MLMLAYLILCNFLLFVGFLNNHQFLTKNQDGRMGKTECLRENLEETREKQPTSSDCVGNKKMRCYKIRVFKNSMFFIKL